MNNPPEYYAIYRKNCRMAAEIRAKAVEFAQTHYNLSDIENFVTDLILKTGGEPAFKRVDGYHWSTCIVLNDAFVHGIPKGYSQPGDIMTIDTGIYYQGTTSDCSTTFTIGEPTLDQKYFLSVGKKTLKEAIKQAKPGNTIKDISKTIQTLIEREGWNVTRHLTGHAIGADMHMEPSIPCFVTNDSTMKIKLVPGMTLAIEVMYMQGHWDLKTDKDGWTMRTKDGKWSAMFEEDVLITGQGPEIMTVVGN